MTSTLPEDTPIEVLVDTAKLRWRIERDYEELKGELGLAHFEGRSWRGRGAVHRSLWLPDPRASGDSPLRLPAPRNVSLIPASQTPGRPRSGPSGIPKAQWRPSDDTSQSSWPEPSCAARAAKPRQLDHPGHHVPTGDRRDEVELSRLRSLGQRAGAGAHAAINDLSHPSVGRAANLFTAGHRFPN